MDLTKLKNTPQNLKASQIMELLDIIRLHISQVAFLPKHTQKLYEKSLKEIRDDIKMILMEIN